MENEEILKLINEAETELPRNAIPKICTILRHLAGVKHLGSGEGQASPELETPMGPADPNGFEAT